MGGRGASSSKNKKLPNYKNAIIPKGKIGNYLVNPDNKNNQGKAVIFNKIGYNMKNKTKLEADLIKGLRKNNARLQKEDIHGKHYIVTMELGGDKGYTAHGYFIGCCVHIYTSSPYRTPSSAEVISTSTISPSLQQPENRT